MPKGALPRRVGAVLGFGPTFFPDKPAEWQARGQEILAHQRAKNAVLTGPLAHGLSALAIAV